MPLRYHTLVTMEGSLSYNTLLAFPPLILIPKASCINISEWSRGGLRPADMVWTWCEWHGVHVPPHRSAQLRLLRLACVSWLCFLFSFVWIYKFVFICFHITLRLYIIAYTFDRSTGETEAGGWLWAGGQPDLHCEFQASQLYIARPSLKQQQQQTPPKHKIKLSLKRRKGKAIK